MSKPTKPTSVKYGVAGVIATALLFHSHLSQADPFDTCPEKAYLFQSNPVQVYGVNLATGTTNLLQGDTGLDANINGVGFDFDNRYLYGYDTSNRQLVRLNKEFKAQTLNTTGLPTGHTFYVGDVHNSVYYLYRKGKGLFTVDLSPLEADPLATLTVNQVSSRAVVNLTDMAFNPVDDKLYGVDNNSGLLYEFDPTTGQESLVGDTGQLGTFGAGYFDVDGYYYVSRNQDGQIYRIDLTEANLGTGDASVGNASAGNATAENVTAVKFADGPYSNQNDGARCAYAPIVGSDSNIDFGDAPVTYATKLTDNGARHELDGVTWLGTSAPDGESDGLEYNLRDDETGIDDENGIGFVTAVEPGLDSIIAVNASTSGYLSAWIDWNQDGDFADQGEQVFADKWIEQGNQSLIFTADIDAQIGSTWSRFRFSQQQGLSYDGGSTSGEVEDHTLEVTGEGLSIRHYPDATGFATVAFEDNWPYTADYDMNDVVVRYRITEILRNGSVIKSKVEGYLGAVGASYHNGFALRLQGLNRSQIDTATTRQIHNGITLEQSGLEAISNEAIFIISEDTSLYKTQGCEFHRTLVSCMGQESVQLNFELHINMLEGTDTASLLSMPYDPFIFATPGFYHGEGYLTPGRSWEVHLPDYAPTEQFDAQLFAGLGSDVSDSDSNVYFKTAGNLPWALFINDEWQWPTERTDLVEAYPNFAQYAESAGTASLNWFQSQFATPGKCYQP
ncbi:LruC domain-containing protein [Vibrio hippocampi]|uniref:LruC domain-containing protein n=1 Tax=Vibrio hippocampi TaxID=654686 RepID=A0ABM8ZN44_9VIBR|nr:LruC domain-containing protein [Vibrio hippocampi]CAH0529976.1 hypothetical protein VHP8226_03702 [Vibrio hippocampi]